MRASRGLKWENKMYKPKRSISLTRTIKTDKRAAKMQDTRACARLGGNATWPQRWGKKNS